MWNVEYRISNIECRISNIECGMYDLSEIRLTGLRRLNSGNVKR